uniref:Cilia- and flagella-associated protein 36 n=1 Tax=Steinernema glaseri TaxID=37863 RepID=A0A1I8AUT2_9BILA
MDEFVEEIFQDFITSAIVRAACRQITTASILAETMGDAEFDAIYESFQRAFREEHWARIFLASAVRDVVRDVAHEQLAMEGLLPREDNDESDPGWCKSSLLVGSLSQDNIASQSRESSFL